MCTAVSQRDLADSSKDEKTMNEAKDPAERTKRAQTLEAARQAKMARSAHAFVRGNTVKFYDWLSSADAGKIPDGPPVWICGDCHLGNLGPLADAEGTVDIQIRDLDQTVIPRRATTTATAWLTTFHGPISR